MTLLVVNPAYDGHHTVHVALVVHTVFAVEMSGLRVMLIEHVVSVHQVVAVAKESPHVLAVVVSHSYETLFGHVAVGLHQCLVDIELLNAVQTRILKLLRARHAVGLHGLGKLQCWIHTDAVEAPQLLGIHAPHGCTDDEVGVLFIADAVE